MLTSEQNKRIIAALSLGETCGSEDDEVWYCRMEDAISGCTSVELHVIAAKWNWHLGWKPLQAIVEHPACDAATALLIFWKGNPESYLDDWMMSCDSNEYDVEHRDLLIGIQKRYSAGLFLKSGIAFDPGPWFVPCKHTNIFSCMRESQLGTQVV